MAAQTFLNQAECEHALALLKKSGAEKLSLWLEKKLSEKFIAHRLWAEVRPYVLGSWSRHELCPKSDIDLLFLGEENKVAELVRDFQKQGVKIRSRIPADLSDWGVGVEPFDILALIEAQAVFKEDEARLAEQIEKIVRRGQSFKRKLIQAIRRERVARADRYDSIANYLEPNLKYGPGGLRDLEQALIIQRLFTGKVDMQNPAWGALRAAKFKILAVRQFLHLSGAGDILIGSLQQEAADFFGHSSVHEFMTEIESLLSDVSFYSDWAFSQCSSSLKKIEQIRKVEFHNIKSVLNHLNEDPSALMQHKVREYLRSKNKPFIPKDKIDFGKVLTRHFNSEMSDQFLVALFKSEILSFLVPELKRLKGHVQHDQYHRYSVDAHTLQATREVLRIKKNSKRLGRLTGLAKGLTTAEWDVLMWAALFHDLGKGLKGDHSELGASIVKREFVKLGLSLKLTATVAWMVKNHLLLSGAAFRRNPQSPSTWSDLFARGVRGRKIVLLTLFTAIDIRATNPDAWNDWKERLLFELCEALQTKKAGHLGDLLDYAEKRKITVSREFIEKLDGNVTESVPKAALMADYQLLQKSVELKEDLPPLLVLSRKKELWIRFHSAIDRPGLFLSFAQRLHNQGMSVQEAFVQTFNDYGAYDWFKVKYSGQSISQLKKRITLQGLLSPAPVQKPVHAPMQKPVSSSVSFDELSISNVRFSVVELISQDDNSAIISFRGRDQRGALLHAARALYEAGFAIESAKVHTWGRQIDDVFTIKKSAQFEEAFKSLQIKCGV